MVTLAAFGAAYANDLYDDSHKSGKEYPDNYHHSDKLWANLPQEKRQILHDAMVQAHKQNEPLQEESEKLDKELDTLLVAPNFDKNAYLDKSAKLGVLHAKMKANMSDAFAGVVGKFTPEERKILAKSWEIRHHRFHHGEQHHDGYLEESSHHHDGEPYHKPQAD
jgi:uncharacterized membrane protein